MTCLAHIAGVPVEETLLAFAPVGVAGIGLWFGQLARRASQGQDPEPPMATVTVRYIVDDVDAAIAFYWDRSASRSSCIRRRVRDPRARGLAAAAERARAAGRWRSDLSRTAPRPEPGGWNRFQLEVGDLEATVPPARRTARFRNEIVTASAATRSSSRTRPATPSSCSSRTARRSLTARYVDR